MSSSNVWSVLSLNITPGFDKELNKPHLGWSVLRTDAQSNIQVPRIHRLHNPQYRLVEHPHSRRNSLHCDLVSSSHRELTQTPESLIRSGCCDCSDTDSQLCVSCNDHRAILGCTGLIVSEGRLVTAQALLLRSNRPSVCAVSTRCRRPVRMSHFVGGCRCRPMIPRGALIPA